MPGAHNEWSIVRMSASRQNRVPIIPGVYLVASVHRAHGVPISTKVLYVGQTRNLRRRLQDHLDYGRAHNIGLSRELISGVPLEFWHKATNENELDKLERKLINELAPIYNKIRYRKMK
jgi:excinuclease UvrABC nuclease subunit